MNKSDWSGLDKLERKLKKLVGTHDVPYDELFNSSFMNRYTQHSTINEFFNASGFEFETEEEFEKISEEEVDKYVQAVTNFNNWQEMMIKAGEYLTAKKLRFQFYLSKNCNTSFTKSCNSLLVFPLCIF